MFRFFSSIPIFFGIILLLVGGELPAKPATEPVPYPVTPEANPGIWRIRTSPGAPFQPILTASQLLFSPTDDPGPVLAVAYRSDGKDGIWIEPVPVVSVDIRVTGISIHIYSTGARGEFFAEWLNEKRELKRISMGKTGNEGWTEHRATVPESFFQGEKGTTGKLRLRAIYFRSEETGFVRLFLRSPRLETRTQRLLFAP